jgi:hypothetical protein
VNGCGSDHRRWKGQIHKSPEAGCRACNERREAVGTMHLSLQADGQTERFCVTTRASFPVRSSAPPSRDGPVPEKSKQ